jgi:hypothetical protein
MNIRPITREEATIRVLAEPDHVPVEGNAWAWAAVTIVVAWGPFEGRAHLGCCSYADEEDFKQPGGYFDDMVAEALEELNRTISETYHLNFARSDSVAS